MQNLPEQDLRDWHALHTDQIDCQFECERCAESGCESRIYRYIQPEGKELDYFDLGVRLMMGSRV